MGPRVYVYVTAIYRGRGKVAQVGKLLSWDLFLPRIFMDRLQFNCTTRQNRITSFIPTRDGAYSYIRAVLTPGDRKGVTGADIATFLPRTETTTIEQSIGVLGQCDKI